MVILEPFWERPAGTQTHSRRTGGKLGQLRYARQGLVRVPESNTKYGGKGRKTGGNAAPVIGPSISESSGIPKRKKSSRDLWRNASPRCSQGRYLFALPDCIFGTQVGLREMSEQPCPKQVVVVGADRGQGAARFHPLPSSMTESKPTARCASRAGGPDVPRHHLGGLGLQLARHEIPARANCRR